MCSRSLLLLSFLLLFAASLRAQELRSVLLIDRQTGEPIADAAFRYDRQTGSSSADGVILVWLVEGAELYITHVAYGSWALSASAIMAADEERLQVFRDPVEFTLFPVDVIAVRPEPLESDLVRLGVQERLAHDGGAVLNRLPSIASVRKSGSYGFDPVLRGFKYDRLNILLNGVQTAIAACPNRMDPPTSQMAPNMTDAIEVFKGPHALRYGNAVGGTINFVPASVRSAAASGLSGRISGGYEGNGDVTRMEGALGWGGDRYDLRLFGAHAQGNDYTDGGGDPAEADFVRSSMGGRAGVQLSDRDRLTISATRNLARDVDFPSLQMDLRRDDTWMFDARHEHTFSRGPARSWKTSVFGTTVDHRMDNGLKQLSPRVADAETEANTLAFGARSEGTWVWGRSELIAGGELRREQAEGTRVREFLMGPNAGKVFADNVWQGGRISKAALFGEYRVPVDNVTVVVSGRMEVNVSTARDPSPEFTEIHPETDATQINTGASIGVRISENHRFSLGAWLARVQRSGSLTERYINYLPVGQDPYELLGDPQLQPEATNEVDLTLAYHAPRTSITLDVFAALLQDYISTVIDTALNPRMPASPGVRRYANLGRAFKTGFEFQWTQALFAGLEHRLDLAYTYGQDLERTQPLPEIAPLDLRLTLFGNYFDKVLRPELALRYVASQGRVSAEYGETATPSFAVLDVTVMYRITSVLGLSAGVTNVFDRAYYEHLNRSIQGASGRRIFAPGRSVVMSLSVDVP